MSLSSTTDRVSYAGNGATLGFSFPYKFFAEADLAVLVKNNTTGVETTKTLTTHYTTTGVGAEAGGTVTMITAPATGETIVIYRNKSAIQELEIGDNGKIPADNLEKELDKIVMMIQRNKNLLGRTIRLPEGFIATFSTLLPALLVNSSILSVRSDGTGFEYVTIQSLINTINTGTTIFTASRAIVSSAAGLLTVSATTAAEIAFISGLTSAVQTQLDDKVSKTTLTTKGDIYAATGAGVVVRKAVGTNGQVLIANSGDSTGVAYSSTPTLSSVIFPATQVPSADVNALDDYEEGTFTPTIVGTSTAGAGTYTLQNGYYTKIGRLVTFQCAVAISAHTGTGNISFGGLPFAATGDTNAQASATIGYVANLAVTAASYPFCTKNTSDSTLAINQVITGGGAAAAVPMDTAFSIYISGSYFTT